MLEVLTITEAWIKHRINMEGNNLEDIRTLILQGNYEEKITYLGSSLLHFTRLKILDLSRNAIKSIKGIEHLLLLEVLNLYYNCIEDFEEIKRLQCNKNLKDLDLRLNPISRLATDYRLFLTNILPNLKNLDCRAIRDAERRAALAICADGVSPYPLHNWSEMNDTIPCVEDLTVFRPTFKHDIPNFKREECSAVSHTKGVPTVNQKAEKSEEGDHQRKNGREGNKLPQSSTSSNPNFTWNHSGNTRRVKHAEFYDRRERYLTEIEAELVEKNHFGDRYANQTTDRPRTISFTGDVKKPSTDTNKPEERKKFTEPQVLPRTRRSNSPGKKFTLSNKYGLKAIGSPKDMVTKSTRTEQLIGGVNSRQSSNTDTKGKTGIDIEAERMDHSFFLMMKNLIQEAVSESFAKYSQQEQTHATSPTEEMPGVSHKVVPPKTTVVPDSSTLLEPERDPTDYAQAIKSVPNDIIQPSAFKLPRSLVDSRVSMLPKRATEELASPGLLKSENQRLLAEVERLKSQLKRYEQTEAEPHAWVVAEPTKVVSRIETRAICSTQNEFIPMWQPIRMDQYTNADKEYGPTFDLPESQAIRDAMK